METMFIENGFLAPAFDGVAGFERLGPNGVRMRQKLIEEWRTYIVGQFPSSREISTPTIIPSRVLKESGHLDRFTDRVAVLESGRRYRLDHFVRELLPVSGRDPDEVEKMSVAEQEAFVRTHASEPVTEFTDDRLLFSVGEAGYLRPELAQGLFMHFREEYDRLNEKLPFGLAESGKSFRKEISTRRHTRLREFHQLELEFFHWPNEPFETKFDSWRLALLRLEGVSMTVEQALKEKRFDSEVVAYAANQLTRMANLAGLTKYRLRKVPDDELAHYARSAWDLEAYVDDHWLEVGGVHDRGDYDLKSHNRDQRHLLPRKYAKPRTKEILVFKPKLSAMGKLYRDRLPKVMAVMKKLTQAQLAKMREMFAAGQVYAFDVDGNSHLIRTGLAEVLTITETITHYSSVPHVVELSIGLDRLMYATLNQNYRFREEDERRPFLTLPWSVTPYRYGLFALSNHPDLLAKAEEILDDGLAAVRDEVYTDFSNTSIGKRYVRADRLGVDSVFTVDFQTLEDDTVTIRSRDTMEQHRLSIAELARYQ